MSIKVNDANILTSSDTFVECQMKKWSKMKKEFEDRQDNRISVITISRDAASKGPEIAERTAKLLEYDNYNSNLIEEIAKSADISASVVESLEKNRLSGIDDFLSSLINIKYLWPGTYLKHLMKVLSIIGKHGRAVIVGRGANFILPASEILSVRIIASLDTRVNNLTKMSDISEKDAKKRIMNRDSKRRAFIRESFNTDILDPLNYDIVINTDSISVETASQIILKTLEEKNAELKALSGSK